MKHERRISVERSVIEPVRMAKDKASANQASRQRVAIVHRFVVMRSRSLIVSRKVRQSSQQQVSQVFQSLHLSDQPIVVKFDHMANKWHFIVFDPRQIFAVNSRVHRK